MEFVCIQAQGDHVPGDVVDVPDGASVSPVHFADPAAPEAIAAMTARGAVSDSPVPAVRPLTEAPADAGSMAIPPLSLPGGAEGSNL